MSLAIFRTSCFYDFLLGTKWQTKSCKFKKFQKCPGSWENVPKVWGVKTVFSQGPDEKRLPTKHRLGLGVLKQLTPSRLTKYVVDANAKFHFTFTSWNITKQQHCNPPMARETFPRYPSTKFHKHKHKHSASGIYETVHTHPSSFFSSSFRIINSYTR